MQKKLIALAVAAAIAPPLAAAEGAAISGFGDIRYTNDNNKSLFTAGAEMDIANKLSDKVAVRVDADLTIGTAAGSIGNADLDTPPDGKADAAGPADSAQIEQAFFALQAADNITVLGGVFNNPIGWEKQDAPDMYQITNGQIFGILDGQTALYSNNVAGVAAAFGLGPVTLTAGVLDDIGLTETNSNSLALVASVNPMEALNVTLGYVTQDEGPAAVPANAGNVVDFNATYKIAGLTAALEYLTADNIVDTAYGLTANYKITDALGVTARYDNVSYENTATKDTTSTTLAASYAVAKNLEVRAEYRSDDNGTTTDDSARAQFVAKF